MSPYKIRHYLCGDCIKYDDCKSIGKDSDSLVKCDKRVTYD